MERVIVEASRVWGIFQSKKDSSKDGTFEAVELAENAPLGVIIYLNKGMHEGKFLPKIDVFVDFDLLYTEMAISPGDCECTVRRIYSEYLPENKLLEKLIEDSDQSAQTVIDMKDVRGFYTDDDLEEMEIEEREADLDDCVEEFLSSVLESGFRKNVDKDEADNIIQDCKEHFLEYLARKHGLTIRRPMILEDEDGEEFFEEYPYEVMIFEDENPIYD